MKAEGKMHGIEVISTTNRAHPRKEYWNHLNLNQSAFKYDRNQVRCDPTIQVIKRVRYQSTHRIQIEQGVRVA